MYSKTLGKEKASRWFAISLVVGMAAALTVVFLVQLPRANAQPNTPAEDDGAITVLTKEIEHLKSLLPDQAHAMKDVGDHFTNLWFAGQKENWPLADFYLAETRSHLKWAVRIRPIRKTAAGDLDLNGILEAVDTSLFATIKESIEKKDRKRFEETYRQSLEGCYACHKSSEKPFLRPRVPKEPEVQIINIDPDAEWPQ